jgi:hypothetical protein
MAGKALTELAGLSAYSSSCGGRIAALKTRSFGFELAGHSPSSGATFRAPLSYHEPRVETLGYSLKPFHGSTLFTRQIRKNLEKPVTSMT